MTNTITIKIERADSTIAEIEVFKEVAKKIKRALSYALSEGEHNDMSIQDTNFKTHDVNFDEVESIEIIEEYKKSVTKSNNRADMYVSIVGLDANEKGNHSVYVGDELCLIPATYSIQDVSEIIMGIARQIEANTIYINTNGFGIAVYDILRSDANRGKLGLNKVKALKVNQQF